MRNLFKHNIFNLQLSEHSILQQDLFSEKTWQFLGLSRKQLIMTGALGGAAMGAGVDLATAGVTFGVFSTLGGVLGAAGTALKGKSLLSGVRLLGMKLDHQQLIMGPVNNIQLMYILMDRALLFYSGIINWAHGRRDYPQELTVEQSEMLEQGVTKEWPRNELKVCERFFYAATRGEQDVLHDRREELHKLLVRKLSLYSEA